MRPEKRRAALPAGEVAFVDEGEGPPVLLLHGFPTSSHLWRDLVPVLGPRFRTVAVDLLGYGDSEKPADPAAITIEAQARMAGQLLDALEIEDPPAVVGHDVGGGVAQLLALERGVGALVLIDAIAFDAWPIEGVRMLQDARPDQIDVDLVTEFVGLAFDLGMTRPERLPHSDRDEYIRPWVSDPMSLVRAARAIDGRGLAGIDERLRTIEARALILWGEEDPFLPPELAERLGSLLPGATVALLPGCSHFVTEDSPEAVLALIAEYLRVHHAKEPHDHAPARVPVDLGISFERPAPVPPEGFEDLG